MNQELIDRQVAICHALQGIDVVGTNRNAERWAWDIIDNANFGQGWDTFVYAVISDMLLYQEGVWELVYPSTDIKKDCSTPPEGRLLGIAHIPWPRIEDKGQLVYTDDHGTAYNLHPGRTLRLSTYLKEGETEPERYRHAFKQALELVIPDVTVGWND